MSSWVQAMLTAAQLWPLRVTAYHINPCTTVRYDGPGMFPGTHYLCFDVGPGQVPLDDRRVLVNESLLRSQDGAASVLLAALETHEAWPQRSGGQA